MQPTQSAANIDNRVPDTIAQRLQACVACHGRQGSATDTGYFPRLAGKPAGYLFNQLRSFRDGRRNNAYMVHLVEWMTDEYLREIAGYFASLDYPYPPPERSDASLDQLARGEKLVRHGDPARDIPACERCHGAALTGVEPGIPALVGLPRLYLASQLGSWITGERHALAPDCMADVGRRLNAEDVRAVTSWLAAQPVPADSHAIAGTTEALALRCSALQ